MLRPQIAIVTGHKGGKQKGWVASVGRRHRPLLLLPFGALPIFVSLPPSFFSRYIHRLLFQGIYCLPEFDPLISHRIPLLPPPLPGLRKRTTVGVAANDRARLSNSLFGSQLVSNSNSNSPGQGADR